MRVVVSVSKFYDWVPVPPDVKVEPSDIASGKVMPGMGGGHRMRVLKVPVGGTHRTCTISEADIIGKIVHEKADVKRAGRTFSRKEAVAHLIQDHLLDEMDWSWITGWDVHDDGPDMEEFHKRMKPLTEVKHARRPGMIIPPEHYEAHTSKYGESTVAADHVDHLHAHYGTAKKVAS
jgi:hypothetical protein